jgi:mannose-1-phosphate guanylyltransferase
MHRTALIMAGGSGERFWPLSRQKRPKQLLRLTSADKTMLDEAIERITAIIAPDNIFIVTSEVLQSAIRDSLQASGCAVPPENVIAEPLKRNTSPCIALGAAFIVERVAERFAGIGAEDVSIAVLTADHFIEQPEAFRASVDAALSHAEQTGELVTFGVAPTRPATGYGYIEVDFGRESKEKKEANAGVSAAAKPASRKAASKTTEKTVQKIIQKMAQKATQSTTLELASELAPKARRVRSFREKPNEETAQDFIERGNFFWNSGMFFWRADSVIAGLKEHLPDVGVRIDDLSDVLRGKTQTAYDGAPPRVVEAFQHMPDISIDFGLMERAKMSHVCLWISVGTTLARGTRSNASMRRTAQATSTLARRSLLDRKIAS